jgi:hypothetical protein
MQKTVTYVPIGKHYPDGAVERVIRDTDEDGLVYFYPFGGGFTYKVPSSEFFERFRHYDPVLDAIRWHAVRVTGDWVEATESGPDSYAAYSTLEPWNGWAVPYFPLDEAIKIAAMAPELEYDKDNDLFILTSEDEDEPERFTATTITCDGKDITVYGIGAGSWCWELVEDDND